MPAEAPPASGPRARATASPWREPVAAEEWIPTDLGGGRTLWRPPPPLNGDP